MESWTKHLDLRDECIGKYDDRVTYTKQGLFSDRRLRSFLSLDIIINIIKLLAGSSSFFVNRSTRAKPLCICFSQSFNILSFVKANIPNALALNLE